MSLIPIPSVPPMITLFDLRDDLLSAWSGLLERDRQLSFVHPYHGEFGDLSCKAIVSPANSFGFMDGGIDKAYTQYFGTALQADLQELIRKKHHGELLVGQADMIETGNKQFPFLICAPTMRVPMVLGKETVNPYLAMRAIMHLWLYGKWNGRSIRSYIDSIAIPGFATGVGRVPVDVCAKQQIAAIRETLVSPVHYPETWHDAQTRHQLLYTNRPYDLQQD